MPKLAAQMPEPTRVHPALVLKQFPQPVIGEERPRANSRRPDFLEGMARPGCNIRGRRPSDVFGRAVFLAFSLTLAAHAAMGQSSLPDPILTPGATNPD